MGQHVGPDGMGGIGQVGDDPEASAGVVDDPSAQWRALGSVEVLNPGAMHRSGCAPAETYPASGPRPSNPVRPTEASPRTAAWRNSHFDPTTILLFIQHLSLVLIYPRQLVFIGSIATSPLSAAVLSTGVRNGARSGRPTGAVARCLRRRDPLGEPLPAHGGARAQRPALQRSPWRPRRWGVLRIDHVASASVRKSKILGALGARRVWEICHVVRASSSEGIAPN